MSNANRKRRIRRTPEQMIADLQEQIKSVKARAAAKELKTSPAIKKAMSALRALDKGMGLAHNEGNSLLHHAMADCRRTLGEFLEKQGMRLPKARMPRGRKPKAE